MLIALQCRYNCHFKIAWTKLWKSDVFNTMERRCCVFLPHFQQTQSKYSGVHIGLQCLTLLEDKMFCCFLSSSCAARNFPLSLPCSLLSSSTCSDCFSQIQVKFAWSHDLQYFISLVGLQEPPSKYGRSPECCGDLKRLQCSSKLSIYCRTCMWLISWIGCMQCNVSRLARCHSGAC